MVIVYILLILGALWLLTTLVAVVGSIIVFAVLAIAACVVLYLLFDFLKGHGTLVLTGLGYILIAAVVLFLLFLLYVFVAFLKDQLTLRKKVKTYVKWLDSIGIGHYTDYPGGKECLEEAIRKRRAIQIDPRNAMSVRFGEAVVNKVQRLGFVRQSELAGICRELAPSFQTEYTLFVMMVLSEKAQFLLLRPSYKQRYCLAKDRLIYFQQILLEHENTGGVAEYFARCREHESLSFLHAEDTPAIRELLKQLTTDEDEIIAARASAVLNNGSE